ncbi:predicted protein, partial [Haematococcus lacustris]
MTNSSASHMIGRALAAMQRGQRSLKDVRSGQLVAGDQLAWWKLTKSQVKHASSLNNARRTTQRWLAPIKPHLQHLAAASSASTSLVANLKHIAVTLATWDAVWEVYMDPKWAQQRLRLYGAQDRALEQFFKKVYFNESVAEARRVTEACLARWDALVARLPDDERSKLQRSMGLKMEQLKAEFDLVAKLHLEE